MNSSKTASQLPNPHPDGAEQQQHSLKLLHQIASQAASLLDVRAPAEFKQGALPNSTNLPILNDDERHQVGITYKQDGAAAAVTLGHQLVGGEVKRQRVAQWLTYCSTASQAGRQPLVMCWRGGQRSGLAQGWLAEQQMNIERVPGGYKALRRACLRLLQAAVNDKHWWILGGRTGVAKTVLIHQLPHSIDLEGRARHRGSAFGGRLDEQPSQATFENALALDCLQHEHAHLVLEDESRTIGRVAIPEDWLTPMRQAPLVLLEASLDQRVKHIYEEYIAQPIQQGQPAVTLRDTFAAALDRISRRLGPTQHRIIAQQLNTAFMHEDATAHTDWISSLLTEYYDPMYDYQLKKKQSRITFSGNFAEVKEFLQSR